ncbi:MAG: hypothetical protein D6696_19140 [Acidobacteria bacterium]|nr:MAG: hypothetical protein D6696_19140 [Acidobacteriota bacterium]
MPADMPTNPQSVRRSASARARWRATLLLAAGGLLAGAAAGRLPKPAPPPLSLAEPLKLLAAGAGSGDQLGWAVAIDGEVLVAGAPGAAVAGPNAGAAYVFERAGDAYQQVQKLVASDGDASDVFGEALGVSGDVIVLGAPIDEPVATGSAYVFERGDDGRWREVQKLVPESSDDNDRVGWSAAIDGDTLVLGAFYDDDGGTFAGSAHVYRRDPDAAEPWRQVAELVAEDASLEAAAGWSVAISGGTVVVGAPKVAGNAGVAHVFERDHGGPGAWGQVATLAGDDTDSADAFGTAVAISGGVILIGAPSDEGNGFASGAAYVFERDPMSGLWAQSQKLVAGDNPSPGFGIGVAIAGSRLLVGTKGELSAGIAYLFGRRAEDGGWQEIARLSPADVEAGDHFAKAVALGGGKAVIGSQLDDDAAADGGAAYVYDLGVAADLAVSADASSAAAVVGAPLRYTVTVENLGPGDASQIALAIDLGVIAEVGVDAITPAAGTYAGGIWRLDALPPGHSASLTADLTPRLDAQPTRGGIVLAAALRALVEHDPEPANDVATLTTDVISRIAGMWKDGAVGGTPQGRRDGAGGASGAGAGGNAGDRLMAPAVPIPTLGGPAIVALAVLLAAAAVARLRR